MRLISIPFNILFRPLALAVTLTALTNTGALANTNPSFAQTALVGTWTTIPESPLLKRPENPSDGLYSLRLNDDGSLSKLDVIKMKSPSWIVKSQNGHYAYTTNEEDDGMVTSLSLEKNGKINIINAVKSHGQQPTHAVISPDGKFLIVSNYSVEPGGAGVTVFFINNDGSLSESVQFIPFNEGSGVIKNRQASGHAHSATFTPDGKFVFIADLGDDKLHAFRYEPNSGTPLKEDRSRNVKFSPGSGPRHMAFTNNGKYAYVTAELTGELVVFSVKNDILKEVKKINLYGNENSSDYKSASGVIISPDGHYVVTANRGRDNVISVMKINENGMPETASRYKSNGIEPRAFSFDETGKYLYVTNVFSNNITYFRFETETGKLHPLGEYSAIPNPTDIKFY